MMHTRRSFSRAFTLAEVIVTAIVAIVLTAIAVPQFSIGAAVGTDGTAQLAIETASSAEVSYYHNASLFTSSSASLTSIDNSVTYVAASTVSTTDTTVSVGLSSGGQVLGLATIGANGQCWLERRSLDPASSADAPVLYATASSSSSYTCTGTQATTINADTGAFTSASSGLSWTTALQLS